MYRNETQSIKLKVLQRVFAQEPWMALGWGGWKEIENHGRSGVSSFSQEQDSKISFHQGLMGQALKGVMCRMHGIF